MTTAYVDIDTAKCTACGSCEEACSSSVLKVRGPKRIINHRHIHVVKPEDCTGCLSCAEACPEGAIQERG
jgi:ferredoxin